MSLQFNDTDTRKGIVQTYEKEIGANYGDISGNVSKLKDLAVDVNLAFDTFFSLGITASGTWQLDDSNHEDYPIISTNLVSGRRDYTFTTDQDSNLILDIYKVMLADSNGTYHEIFPVDVQSKKGTEAFYDGLNLSGLPNRYDKTANAIFLEYPTNYSLDEGLKMYINREPSYFTYTDTTKMPGVPGLFHRYFAIKPAMDYARRHSLANYSLLASEVLKMEGDPEKGIVGSIARYFGARQKDERNVMTGKKILFI